MSSGNDHAVWTFSQSFTSDFRSNRLELEKRLESLKASPTPDAIQALSADIAKLAKTLSDATGSLPSYDQKLYETACQLHALETNLNRLRAATTTKPKFAFKRKTAAESPPSTITPSESTKGALISTSPQPSSSNSFISSHTHTYLTITSLVGSPPASDLTISDLDHCILNLLSTKDDLQLDISAIHLRKISNSVLLLPIINGSILIHDLSRCVIVLGCHQFRMHSSTKVDVFLSISSNPIIEDGHDVRFAPYPRALLTPEQPQESITTPPAVQDFSHIRNTPSPNWIHMEESDTSRPWPMGPLHSRSEIESSLQDILPA
ncbi:hypothetical protein D9756_008724 [Leucocoprinus leucothites]|uniref:C-CAP/cofactor C-like domain-containing protein n=1 Tax=Leucocoprinus leucothites TaxID=201217 RepID=A0A8H5FUS6_9AGAR|nr:hypothetical protein D9756_008724 [Leucoagaricus leucothites]